MTDTALVLGSFDGLHIGHMQVLGASADCKRRVAMVFGTPPAMVIGHKSELLMLPDEKNKRLCEMGFEVVPMEFSLVRDIPADEFLRQLNTRFSPKKICCGFNYRFGKNAGGDVDMLKRFCLKNGITLSVTPPVESGGERVSSSRIRALIADGRPEEAMTLLGRRFEIKGCVESGDGRGRTLGFPTANFDYPQQLVRPRYGVYAVRCLTNGKELKAVCNIGVRPTFSLDKPIVETYILDYSADLYGKTVSVGLEKYIRPERVFSSPYELRRQIALDIEAAQD